MATSGWLNSNADRSYPLVEAVTGEIPVTALVEAGFIAWPESGYVPGTHSVWVYQVRLESGSAVLEIHSDAPGLVGKNLTLVVPPSATEFSLWRGERNQRDSESSSLEESSSYFNEDCLEFPLWEGFVVVGNVSDLLAYAATNPFPTAAQARFEPCLVQSLTSSVVTSINLANGDRTRAEPADGCPGIVIELPGDPPFVVAKCLVGDVRLEDGYNLDAAQSSIDTAITVGASSGAGAGLACEEVPVFPGEEFDDGTLTYDGAPRCEDVVSNVNGLTGPHLNILARPGTRIIPDQDTHTVTLVVDVGLAGFCTPEE